MSRKHKLDLWTGLGLTLLLLFGVFFLYPCARLLWEAFYTADDGFTMKAFVKFFSKKYYYKTILNSFKVSAAVMVISLLLGIPFSYFFSFYKLKGRKFLFITCLLCTMSAPFIGAYSWIMLLGRSGVITQLLEKVGIEIGSIYGFGGILLVQSLKLFPLVVIYMNGAFADIDNSLMEASANLGCTGVKRFFKIVLGLTAPTILAAALIVFMRAFADFGTPALIGEGYKVFPVLIYDSFLSEVGADYNFASAVSVIAIVVTAAVFLLQKYATSKFKFTINSLHPVEKKKATGIGGVLMHIYCYVLVGISLLPQGYIIYDSFRDYKGQVAQATYSWSNYQNAVRKLLGRSIRNTLWISVLALIVIIIIAVIVAYLVVRRSSMLSHTIDTISMLPYIMPGSVVGLGLLLAFGAKPLALTGTFAIMVISFVIRRLPYTIRSATATLMQISLSIEEAAISLGASKLKTFIKITVPMMANGILSGAILSWVAIVTELSSSIILYSNKSITLTMSTYLAILRGNDGIAAAFATILTLVTTVSLILYLWVSKSEDVKL